MSNPFGPRPKAIPEYSCVGCFCLVSMFMFGLGVTICFPIVGWVFGPVIMGCSIIVPPVRHWMRKNNWR